MFDSSSPHRPDARASAHLELLARSPTTEIEVFDHRMDRVAHGFGVVATDVAPGIYQLVYRAGSSQVEELVALKPHEQLVRSDVGGQFLSAAPLSGTSAASESHFAAALLFTAANRLHRSVDGGELAIFVRELDAGAGLPEDILGRMSVHNADDVPFTRFSDRAVERWPGCAGLRTWQSAGGYTLRTHPDPSSDALPIDQSLWIERGWQTIVFVACRKGRLLPGLVSIHMVPQGTPWDPDGRPDQRLALALEGILSALREGRCCVSKESESLLFSNEPPNPMLTLATAHSILQDRTPDWKFFDSVMGRLNESIPGHPDLACLECSAYERKLRSQITAEPPTRSVSWPPLFSAGYRGALRCDARHPELAVIEPSSKVEREAANLVDSGIWSTWVPMASGVADEVTRLPSSAVPDAPGGLASISEPPPASLIEAAAAAVHDVTSRTRRVVIGGISDRYLNITGSRVAQRSWAKLEDEMFGHDARRERIRSFLKEKVEHTEARTATEFLRKLDPGQISLAVGVPVRSVTEVLRNAHEVTDRNPEPRSVQLWLVVSDLMRSLRSKAAREHLDALRPVALWERRRNEIELAELEEVLRCVRAKLHPESEFRVALARASRVGAIGPLKPLRSIVSRLDPTVLGAVLGLPYRSAQRVLEVAARWLDRIDALAVARTRASLDRLVALAWAPAAREFFEEIDVEQVSRQTRVPISRVAGALALVTAELPEGDILSMAQVQRGISQVLETSALRAARECADDLKDYITAAIDGVDRAVRRLGATRDSTGSD